MSSKLNSELVTKAVDDILAFSAGETIKKGDTEIVGKKRKFTESIELQVKAYIKPALDAQRNCSTHTSWGSGTTWAGRLRAAVQHWLFSQRCSPWGFVLHVVF